MLEFRFPFVISIRSFSQSLFPWPEAVLSLFRKLSSRHNLPNSSFRSFRHHQQKQKVQHTWQPSSAGGVAYAKEHQRSPLKWKFVGKNWNNDLKRYIPFVSCNSCLFEMKHENFYNNAHFGWRKPHTQALTPTASGSLWLWLTGLTVKRRNLIKFRLVEFFPHFHFLKAFIFLATFFLVFIFQHLALMKILISKTFSPKWGNTHNSRLRMLMMMVMTMVMLMILELSKRVVKVKWIKMN